MKFKDRSEAGRRLAGALSGYEGQDDILVLALPRGGVPVAYEIAQVLHAPLDIWLVRKLGIPGQEEVAMGAIAMGGVAVLNNDILEHVRISERDFEKVILEEKEELMRRDRVYRGNKPLPKIKDKTVIIVDDGLATGATMRAAILALKEAKPRKIIVAVPVGTDSACELLRPLADEIICLTIPMYFMGVGGSYEQFPQNSDEEVKNLLEKAHE